MTDIKQQLLEYAGMIERSLPGYLPVCPQPEATVREAMEYSLLSGGKRIRGALVLAFYRLFSADAAPALPFAGALEMVHAYSLIHDDLPCMDNDDMRRGKPSCHIAYGEAAALLAGDGLLTLAFETITNEEHTKCFSNSQVLKATNCLARAAGIGGMIGGQVIDLNQEGKKAPAELLERMYTKKTGALIAAGAQLGCALGGAGASETALAVEYCHSLGLAFQITDDILDLVGEESLLGKPTGSDEENGKNTYARLHGIQAAQEEVLALSEKAVRAIRQITVGDTAFLEGLVGYLARRDH